MTIGTVTNGLDPFRLELRHPFLRGRGSLMKSTSHRRGAALALTLLTAVFCAVSGSGTSSAAQPAHIAATLPPAAVQQETYFDYTTSENQLIHVTCDWVMQYTGGGQCTPTSRQTFDGIRFRLPAYLDSLELGVLTDTYYKVGDVSLVAIETCRVLGTTNGNWQDSAAAIRKAPHMQSLTDVELRPAIELALNTVC